MPNSPDENQLVMGTNFFLTIVGLIVSGVAWLIRLEARGIYGERDQRRIEKRVEQMEARAEAMESKIFEKLSKFERVLARIEERLDIKEND